MYSARAPLRRLAPRTSRRSGGAPPAVGGCGAVPPRGRRKALQPAHQQALQPSPPAAAQAQPPPHHPRQRLHWPRHCAAHRLIALVRSSLGGAGTPCPLHSLPACHICAHVHMQSCLPPPPRCPHAPHHTPTHTALFSLAPSTRTHTECQRPRACPVPAPTPPVIPPVLCCSCACLLGPTRPPSPHARDTRAATTEPTSTQPAARLTARSRWACARRPTWPATACRRRWPRPAGS